MSPTFIEIIDIFGLVVCMMKSDDIWFRYNTAVDIGLFYLEMKPLTLNRRRAVNWLTVVQ